MAEERKGVLLRFPLHLLARVDQEAGALNRTEFLLSLITEGLDRREPQATHDPAVPDTHMLAGAALTPPREPAPYPADFETSGADTSEDGGPGGASSGRPVGPADPGEPGDPDTGSPEPLVVDW